MSDKLNPKDIIVEEVDGIDMSDFPDFVDAYISVAYNTNTDLYLTDEELDEFNDSYPEIAQEQAYNRVF